MQAAEDGKQIEQRGRRCLTWKPVTHLTWDWSKCDYRVASYPVEINLGAGVIARLEDFTDGNPAFRLTGENGNNVLLLSTEIDALKVAADKARKMHCKTTNPETL